MTRLITIATRVISGDVPKAIGIGPIMTSPAKSAFRADNSVPIKTAAKPININETPNFIKFIDFSFLRYLLQYLLFRVKKFRLFPSLYIPIPLFQHPPELLF